MSEWTPMGLVTSLCTVCDRPSHAHIGRGHDFTPAPAVPVGVQPERQDALIEQADALDEAIWRLDIDNLSQYDIQRIVRVVALPCAAAVVAALREDLATRVEALRAWQTPGYQDFNDGLDAAVALIRGRS